MSRTHHAVVAALAFAAAVILASALAARASFADLSAATPFTPDLARTRVEPLAPRTPRGFEGVWH